MPLETATTIPTLNALWPLGSDSKGQGDDHIRMIKAVLQAEFPTGAGGTVAATAQSRSRIVNGAMQMSQENLNTAGTTAAGYYAADQWATVHVSAATITSQRVQVVTPNGSRDRYRATITVSDAALAAGDVASIMQPIEGIRVADFRYGTASAKQAVLRFGWKSPAGTYSIAIGNGTTATRSYIAQFTIAAGAANTDTEQTLVIPGDTAGAWLTDTSAGLVVRFVLAAGSTFQGVAGWQAGNVFALSSNSNGMGTGAAVFELFDVGLYLDVVATGKAPAWVMPDEAQELAACRRYFARCLEGGIGNQSSANLYGPASGVTAFAYMVSFQAQMRVVPTVSTSSSHTYANCSAGAYISDAYATTFRVTVTALGAYRALVAGVVDATARM